MRCAALRLPWFGRRCGGEVGRVTPGGCGKGDVSWSQDRYQPARNSILAAGSDPKRCVCEIPLSAHSPQNLGHFPTAVKQTESRVRLRAHSVATKSDILPSIFEVADAAARSAMQPCFITSIRAWGEPQTGLLPTRLPRSQPRLIPTSPPTPSCYPGPRGGHVSNWAGSGCGRPGHAVVCHDRAGCYY